MPSRDEGGLDVVIRIRSMIGAMDEMAAVPKNSVESSTARMNRGDLGAPRKRSHRAANETVETESGTLLAIVREPMQPERSAEVQYDVAKGHQREHTTKPGQPGLPQRVVDVSFGGIHEAPPIHSPHA